MLADVLNVPLVSVNVFVAPIVSAEPSVQAPPTPFSVVATPIVTPLVVIVLPVVVALNVNVPAVFVTEKLVAWLVHEPDTVSVDEAIASVIAPSNAVGLPTLKSLQSAPETVTVNAPVPVFELASKNTLSTAVGADAPAVPPELVAQLAVLAADHVPLPPTH